MLLLSMSWRESWMIFAAILAVCIPLAHHFLLKGHDERHRQYLESINEDATSELTEKKSYRRKQWTRAEVIRDPLFYLFTPGLLAQSLLFTGFMFHQIHLVEEKGWPLAVWGSLYLLYALSTIVMNLIVGALVDRFGRAFSTLCDDSYGHRFSDFIKFKQRVCRGCLYAVYVYLVSFTKHCFSPLFCRAIW